MPLTWTAYYGLARVQDGGPETKNWAVLYDNPQQIALMLKSLEQHHHNWATPMNYPGYNYATPATPTQGNLTLNETAGSVSAGTSVGVRFSFLDNLGLETQASPEITLSLPATAARPDTPTAGPAAATPVPGALTGGTYVYAITKALGAGETDISNVVQVTVPFNATSTSSYTVPVVLAQTVAQYNAIDGTDSINFYRSTGYDASFVQLGTFTLADDPDATTFIDDNTVAANTQPPQSPTFASNNSIGIDWSNLAQPTAATRFRVYITQQPGVYGSSSLLQDYPMNNPATPLPTNYSYMGTETLIADFPKEFSQGIGSPPPVYLPTEAYGAPYYSQPANAYGWETYNFVLSDQNNTTPIQGAMYVDRQAMQLKVALATPSTAGGPSTFTTFGGVGSGYSHPLAESGGHAASHILGSTQGGPTQDLFNNIFTTPVGNSAAVYRKSATTVYKATATPTTLQNSTVGVWETMPDMVLSGINPDFPGQWLEVDFMSAMLLYSGGVNGQVVSTQLYINGVSVTDAYSVDSSTYNASNFIGYATSRIHFATPITRSNNTFQVEWFVSYTGYVQSLGSNIAGQGAYRSLYVKELF